MVTQSSQLTISGEACLLAHTTANDGCHRRELASSSVSQLFQQVLVKGLLTSHCCLQAAHALDQRCRIRLVVW